MFSALASTIVRRRRAGRVRTVLATVILAAWSAAPIALGAGAGAFTAPDDPAVPALVVSLRACLTRLPVLDQQALRLRAGLDGSAPRLSAQVAAALGRTPAAETAAEVSAIRKLETQRRLGLCQARPARTTAAAKPARPTATSTPAAPARTPGASTTSSSSSSKDSTTGVLEVAVPALLVLAFFAGLSFEMYRRPRT